MKNRSTCLLLLLIFSLFLFSGIKAQVLSVPEIYQEQDNWCWAGVSKCVLDYCGFFTQQCEIAEYTRSVSLDDFGLVDCCIDPSQGCNQGNYNYGASGSIEDILVNFGGVYTSNLPYLINEVQWQTEISNNRPFIIRYGWNGGGGHFVVGYGVTGSDPSSLDYFTMDPWFNEGYTMSSYNWIVTAGGGGSWTHTQLTFPPITSEITSINTDKRKLLKTIDVLGRETEELNQTLFYLNDNGVVEKKLIIE